MSTVLRFDTFEVDLAAGRLFKGGSRIRLREQSFQVLAMLLERPGEVVTREDLRRRLWPTDVFVDFENSLNAAVARLREALGDSADRPRFIETLPKRGYRFIGTASASDRQIEAPSLRRWRPAAGRDVPNTPWVLEEKLGEGGFAEVWLARHRRLKEPRVFKFCVRDDRVRALKREMTLFRVWRARVGDHPHLVKLLDVHLEQPPFYLEEEYVQGRDLRTWCAAQGGAGKVPLDVRLELVAQAAEGLAAAHEAGIIHRDVKPGNILVVHRTSESGSGGTEDAPTAKLTDFGVGQVVSAEVLAGITATGFSGTLGSGRSATLMGSHAYLAPELLMGRPATTQSDVYSMGVVLYQLLVEDFARPVTTDWERELPDAAWQEDLQRCLAGRPEERFRNALELAANIRAWSRRSQARTEQLHVLPVAGVEHGPAPGPVASDDNQDCRPLSRGSPEDLASAALPTPTAEAVAASDETFGISVRGAVLGLIAAVVLLVPVLALSGRVTDLGKTRPELSSTALAARAREIAVKAGWPARPKDATYGFLRDEAYFDYLDAHRFDWKQLGALRPAHIQFWYQQGPRWLVPSGIKSGVPASKWPTGPGVTSLLLDARGDLLQFHTTPPEPGVRPAAHPADWAALFDAAGLDIARFKGAPAGPGGVRASDDGQTWLGASVGAPDIPIRVDGAGLGGRVVSFVVVRPWSSPASTSAPATVAPSALGPNLPGIQTVAWASLIAACVLAWRNRTRGLADLRGAFRLAAGMFCLRLCEWFLLEHLTPTGESVQRLTLAVGSSCFAGASVFVVYVALEPYARRYWPASLISWTRLMAGRGRDPLLGRDVLVGVVVGLGMSVAYWLHAIHAGQLGYRPSVYTDALNALELRTVLARIAYCAWYGVWTAAGGLLILILARLVLRKEWIAAAFLTLVSAVAWAPRLGTGPFPLQVAYMIAVFGPWVWALRRYGLVVAAVATFVSSVRKMAITPDPLLWYASHTLIVGALLLALIGYGFHTALGGRRVWREDLEGV